MHLYIKQSKPNSAATNGGEVPFGKSVKFNRFCSAISGPNFVHDFIVILNISNKKQISVKT